jgi:hypothetical protein
MVKFFKNGDILNTSYSVSNKNTINNIVSEKFIAGTSGEYFFPIKIDVIECDNNKSGSCETSVTNKSLFLDYTEDETKKYNFQIGKKMNSDVVFYDIDSTYYNSDVNPTNRDGSYKSQVHNTTTKMYYNDYNNCYNIFGFDGFDTSKTTLNLEHEFSLLKLKISSTGNKIAPKSVNIRNQSGDLVGNIMDDGNNNLFLSGSYFIEKQVIKSDSKNITTNMNISGIGYTYLN